MVNVKEQLDLQLYFYKNESAMKIIVIYENKYVKSRELCPCHFLITHQDCDYFISFTCLVHSLHIPPPEELVKIILVGWIERSFKQYSSMLHSKSSIGLHKLPLS